MTAPRVRTILLGVVVLAVVLRVPTLGAQSLWADEAATVDVLDRGFGDLYAAIRDQESTPPLFYVVAWFVAQVLGLGEAAVRVVPVLAGIATVPVVAAIGMRLGGPRAAVAGGLLVATNPLLVWFSQEARAYALLVLLCALSVLLLLRLLDAPRSPGRLVAWGVVVGLAFATHYFAVFLAAAEAAWLLAVLRRGPGPVVRPLATGLAPASAIGLTLLPMFLEQRSADRASFISQEPFSERAAQIPKQFLVGYDAPVEVVFTTIAVALAVLALGALALAVRRGDAAAPARSLAIVAAFTLLVPFALAVVGDDYVIARNLIPALAVVLALIAAGIVALPPRAGVAVAAGLALIGTSTAVAVQATDRYQREDWRAAIDSIGPPTPGAPRLVVVTPGSGRVAALHYLGEGAFEAPDDPSAVVVAREIAVVSVAERGEDGSDALRRIQGVVPLTGFVPSWTRTADRWATARFVALVPSEALVGSAGSGIPRTVVLVEP